MLGDILRIGDEVIVTIPEENRMWGYNPCPDDTKAKVLGFCEIYHGRIDNYGLKPGVYVNNAWAILQLEDGREHKELSMRLSLADSAEYERRLAEFRNRKKTDWRAEKEFLRDLPETPFWEGDWVRVLGRSIVTVCTSTVPPEHSDPAIFQIINIQYSLLSEKTNAGKNFPAYNISSKLRAGWHTATREDQMVLVERGPVWKFYHNEPITFNNIDEEASFFETLGHTEDVRNPANGNFNWTRSEALRAIQIGLIHWFIVRPESSGKDPKVIAKRFRDEKIGSRVAQATLEKFGLVPK